MNIWREQKALIIQPTRCRSDGNMADILSEGTTTSKQRQVFHSRTARSFDEGQPRDRRVLTRNNGIANNPTKLEQVRLTLKH